MKKSQLNAISYAYAEKRYRERAKKVGDAWLLVPWLCYLTSRVLYAMRKGDICKAPSKRKMMSDFCRIKWVREALGNE